MTSDANIHNNWSYTQLKESISYVKGKKPDNLSEEFIEGYLPYLSTEYLRKGIVTKYAELTGKVISVVDNEILLLWDGSNAGEFLKGKNGILSSTMVKIKHESKDFVTLYLYYQLKKKESYLRGLTQGTGIPHVDRNVLMDIRIPRPPLLEQHKIASILSKVDENISHTEAIIEKTEELKKGLMQKLLTKGIEHTSFKKTEIGEIPDEWDVRSLPHVFNVIDYRGRTPPFSDNGIPYIGADNIKNESIVFSNRRYVSDETYEQYMTRGIPNPGDILFTTEAPLGKVAQAPNYKFCLAQRLVAFQCKNAYDPTFFMYILKSDVVQKQFLDWSTGTTVKGISAKNMKFIKLSCPRDVTEQKKIGRILSQVDDQLSQNQTYLSHLQELKKGLMQDLLTGKVRVGN